MHPKTLSPVRQTVVFVAQSNLYSRMNFRSSAISLADKFSDSLAQVVARVAERLKFFGFGAEADGILDAPMNPLRRAGEDWTMLSGVIADGDNVIKRRLEKLVQ